MAALLRKTQAWVRQFSRSRTRWAPKGLVGQSVPRDRPVPMAGMVFVVRLVPKGLGVIEVHRESRVHRESKAHKALQGDKDREEIGDRPDRRDQRAPVAHRLRASSV